VGQVHKITGGDATPTFGHAETFLAAHTLADAWSLGDATKYRQTLTALAGRFSGTPAGADVAVLDTPAGTSTPTLLVRSRHTSVRSLARYARPGPEAVAAHVAATDPAARRKAGQGC
jgi:hypothetical protein